MSESFQMACANLTQTQAELDSLLPPLTLVFGKSPSISVQTLPTESYLKQETSSTWCQVMCGSDAMTGVASMVGSAVLRSNITIFDRANNRIGFAPHASCP